MTTFTPKPGEFHEWKEGQGWVENQAAKDEAAAEIARKSEMRQDERHRTSETKIKTYANDTFPNLSAEQKVILGLILLSVKLAGGAASSAQT